MSNYKIFRTEEFDKRMSKFDNQINTRIEKKLSEYIITQLKNEPHYGSNIKKLRDYNPETWRYRIGDFRIFYVIEEKEKVVGLLTIDDRKDAY